MKFPFSISQKISHKQGIQKITSESYIIHQLEESLSSLDMRMTKMAHNELFLQKSDIFNTWRKKDYLRNLTVKVDSDQETIRITLESNTILIFVVGLCPYFFYFIPGENPPFLLPVLISLFFWGIGFLVRSLVLSDVKNDLKSYLKTMT